MHVHLTKVATRQLQAIVAYVFEENPDAARKIVARVEETRALLARNPEIGRKLSHGRLRWFPLTPFPYVLYYEASEQSVRIVRIWHAGRNRASLHEPATPFQR